MSEFPLPKPPKRLPDWVFPLVCIGLVLMLALGGCTSSGSFHKQLGIGLDVKVDDVSGS